MFAFSVGTDHVAKVRSRCHSAIGICAALVGSAFACRRATGERETYWHKRGASLVSGVIGCLMCHVWTDRVAKVRS